MSFLHNIYGLIFRPTSTFKNLSHNYSPIILIQGIGIVIIATAFGKSLDIQETVATLLTWFFFSSLLFLNAYIFVLPGRDYWKTLGILGFTALPLIFHAPVDILAENNPIIASLLRIFISIWIFNLNLIAVSTLCSIRKRKAILIYLLLPLAMAFVLTSVIVKFISEVYSLI